MFDLGSTSALFALVAEFLKTRRETNSERNEQAFEAWLVHEAFPALLAKATETFVSVRTLQLSERERFAAIMEELGAIRAAIEGDSPERQWLRLGETEQAILRHFQNSKDFSLDLEELEAATARTTEQVERAGRLLAEKGLLVCREYSGGISFSASATGQRFAWMALARAEYEDAIIKVHRILSDASSSKTIRASDIAITTGLPADKVDLIVSLWNEQGLLRMDRYDHGDLLIYSISETLRQLK